MLDSLLSTKKTIVRYNKLYRIEVQCAYDYWEGGHEPSNPVDYICTRAFLYKNNPLFKYGEPVVSWLVSLKADAEIAAAEALADEIIANIPEEEYTDEGKEAFKDALLKTGYFIQ